MHVHGPDPGAVTVPTPLSFGFRSLRTPVLACELPDQGIDAAAEAFGRIYIVNRLAYSYCHGSKGGGEGKRRRKLALRPDVSVATVFLYSLTRNPLSRNPPLVRSREYLTHATAPPIQSDLLCTDELAVTITPARLGVHQAHTSFDPSSPWESCGTSCALFESP
jgi:hypothetical protein